jgi:hypothetical protein
MRPYDRPNCLADLLVIERQMAAYLVPGEEHFHNNIRVNAVPQQMATVRRDG